MQRLCERLAPQLVYFIGAGKAAATAVAAVRAWELLQQLRTPVHILVSDINSESLSKFSSWGATTGWSSCVSELLITCWLLSRHTSRVTRHASHVTRHTSHVTGVCSCRSVLDTLAFLAPHAPKGCDLVVSVASCRSMGGRGCCCCCCCLLLAVVVAAAAAAAVVVMKMTTKTFL
jgi:hypothetical protein